MDKGRGEKATGGEGTGNIRVTREGEEGREGRRRWREGGSPPRSFLTVDAYASSNIIGVTNVSWRVETAQRWYNIYVQSGIEVNATSY